MAPIHVPAAYEHIVTRLRRAIWLGELIPGERLPSERALAEGFEVSRLTIREALRTLQGEGLLTIRRGSSGGAIVASKDMTAEQRHRLLLESREQLRHVHEIRQGVEPMAARLAAQRATSDQLDRLRSCQDELLASTDVSSFRRADSAFHMTVAHASGNPLLSTAVEDARSTLFIALDAQHFDVLKLTSANAHQAIVQAIEAKDPDRAAQLMSEHLDEAWSEIEAVIDGPAKPARKRTPRKAV